MLKTWMPGIKPDMTSKWMEMFAPPSKHLEIFALLPVRDFGLEAFELRVLDVVIVIDKACAELFAEETIGLQRVECLAQRFRECGRLRFVRRIGRRRRLGCAIDAIEARQNLRGRVKI